MGFIAGFFGVIAVICGIVALLCHLGVKSYEKEERREQEAQEQKRLETMYRELEAGTWKFPVYELEEELENLGIKYPVDDAAVSGANQVILGILNRYGVPHQYHGRYLGKEQINGYFLELERLEREQVIAAIQKHAIRNGATSITTEAGYQKARVIMENVLEESDIPDERRSKYMEREQIESCFTEVSIRLQQIQERKRQTRLEKKRKEEAALAKEYAKETRYIGRERASMSGSASLRSTICGFWLSAFTLQSSSQRDKPSGLWMLFVSSSARSRLSESATTRFSRIESRLITEAC